MLVSVSLNMQAPQESVPITYVDVVIVGAGPYGLSTAAHLLGKGLKVAIFGKPLNLWRENMPQGMFLRSYWWATNLSDPDKKYSFERYFESHNMEAPDPLPLEIFVDYGLWFQKQCVPDVDETYVQNVTKNGRYFDVTLVDGRVVRASAVVMAPGLQYYAYSPSLYAHLSADAVSHASIHHTYEQFAGKRVIVIGGGQYALESAALLHEHGARVDLASRHPIHWLVSETVEGRSWFKRIRYPKAGIAPGWFNWSLENLPYGFQRLPRRAKDRLMRGRGRYGPAGAGWLKPRVVGSVTLHESAHVQRVEETDAGVVLQLSDHTSVTVDHVMLATGYRVDLKRLPMLPADLLSKIVTYQDTPVLKNSFESNISGLYFVGISSVSSFGPFYRFVVGTEATARRVAGAIAQHVAHIR